MKGCYKFIILLLMTILLTGCTDANEIEEQYKMSVTDYIERTGLNLTFEVKDNYETAEDTYLEIVRWAFWCEEKQEELDSVFNFWNYKHDDVVNEVIDGRRLVWTDAEKYFDEAALTYQTTLEEVKNKSLKEILNASTEEIRLSQESIYSELEYYGFQYIVEVEKYRLNNSYRKMFLSCREIKFLSDIYLEFYPTDVHQGALDCIYGETTVAAIDTAKEYFIEIGEYEKYAEDIEYYRYWINEAWRCDYGTCTEWGAYTSKGHAGEFCWWHAEFLEDGGIYRKKERLPFKKSSEAADKDEEEFNGNQGGPDLSYSNEENTSNENSSSDKADKQENKKPYDPYDVYDYDDPEDFYYDWEEDFDGYEDAEDYWYDAWDEI